MTTRNWNRAANLYPEFRPSLEVNAIREDLSYRSLYLETPRQRLFLPEDGDSTIE